MPLRLVLFDFDDTLFDHKGTVEAAFVKMSTLHDFLLRRPLHTIIEVYHESLETMHPDILAGKLTLEQGRAKRFHDVADHCGITLTEEEAIGLAKEYRRIYCESELATDGVFELLSYAKERFTIGIVTNNIRIEQETRAKALGLSPYIDFMVTFEDSSVMKPEPKMLQMALEQGKASVDETVLIGDSLATDVEAAIRMDMRCIWYCSEADYEKFEHPNPPKTLRIAKLIEAIPILNELS